MLPMARGQVARGGYDTVDPYNLLGAKPAAMVPSGTTPSPIAAVTGSLLDRGDGKPWHPDNGLFWFGVIAATTLGLIGASTSLRVGPFRAAVSGGKS